MTNERISSNGNGGSDTLLAMDNGVVVQDENDGSNISLGRVCSCNNTMKFVYIVLYMVAGTVSLISYIFYAFIMSQ